MINRFEATGIFLSVALMAVALFLLNMETATQSLRTTGQQSQASVVLSDENPASTLYDSVDTRGRLSRLVIDDVIVGAGEAVSVGDTVSVHYIGTLQNGQQFDNSYQKAKPFEFTVGKGQVIAGWDEGVVGMRVGGQRILAVPSDMAYGNRTMGPIPANSTLVFVIELLEVK